MTEVSKNLKRRTRSASVSPTSKPKTKQQTLEVISDEPRLFMGPYSQFVQNGLWVYRLRKYRAIQAMAEALKPHFKLYHFRYKVELINNIRYLCYSTHRNPVTGRVFDVIPYDLVWEFNFDEQFRSELKAVYFFRFLLGFKTVHSSLEVAFDGRRYHPISAAENAFCRKPIYSMPHYKITTSLPEKYDDSDVLWISPAIETKKILGSLTTLALHNFIDKIRNQLREIDPKYVYVANSIRETLLNLVSFEE